MSNNTPSTSFAEGALVRSMSALYRSYGVGRVMKVCADQAKVESSRIHGAAP